MSFGRNQFGQLGHPKLEVYETPTIIAELENVNVIQAACGRNHSLFLTGNAYIAQHGFLFVAEIQIQKIQFSIQTLAPFTLVAITRVVNVESGQPLRSSKNPLASIIEGRRLSKLDAERTFPLYWTLKAICIRLVYLNMVSWVTIRTANISSTQTK